ncbi:hypothetical protein A1O3_01816 [Capronia epimyces CBS 606.96]|uniref:FAD dependent oxidoreductase domain-containing protein n=1 Tax=Capronia epimyces CBS 606.96 TaxID=1182542 RepID=W9Y7D1_9EURO|nr:uncharacterized protein A1O3_01816 [Capronia epimyces CBS 606.96]EXJ88752.1 hypothetical protein A1O3_01816 [Capronia epimyces CBS 606.96]
MNKEQRVVIIGAGVFGLSTALQLSSEGYKSVVVLDRHTPPVPDGSSVDISRVIRFDYGDGTHTAIAKEAYDLWATSPLYKDVFFPTPFVVTATNAPGRSYIDKCLHNLDQLSLPYQRLQDAQLTKRIFPALTGDLGGASFHGYWNSAAGWADAQLAITLLRDQCIEAGVSFISGARGTVTAFRRRLGTSQIVAVQTRSGNHVEGDIFVLAAGAWSSRLAPMRNTVLATGQVVGYLRLSELEMDRYQNLPIYINFDSGFLLFPPHRRSGYLKFMVHGYGYTRQVKNGDIIETLSSPTLKPRSARTNFAPSDGVDQLRKGLAKALPELADRAFERACICWYNDTPTGEFVLDYHPDHENLFVATGGSGHAFKFLPVLGKYIVGAMKRDLPLDLLHKWRFRTEYCQAQDLFKGDGSRGGPHRREFLAEERAKM